MLLDKEGFLAPEAPVIAELRGGAAELGRLTMAPDDGLRVDPVKATTETDAGDAAAAGGEVGRGL